MPAQSGADWRRVASERGRVSRPPRKRSRATRETAQSDAESAQIRGGGGAQFPQGVRSGDGSPGAFRWAGGDVARGSEEAGPLTRRCGPGERSTSAVRSVWSGACGVRNQGPRWDMSIPNMRTCFLLAALAAVAASPSGLRGCGGVVWRLPPGLREEDKNV